MVKVLYAFSAMCAAVMLYACTKSSNHINCLTVIPPVYLDFNIADKETGADLFFSDDPVYQPEDIFLIHKVYEDHYDTLRTETASFADKQYFRAELPAWDIRDTVFIEIATLPADTLVYTTVTDGNRYCPRYFLNTVEFNGEQTGYPESIPVTLFR